MRSDAYNPFSGITPNFGPFAPLLESRLGVVISIIWAGAFVFVAALLILAGARMAKAKKGGYHDEFDEARVAIVWPLVALVVLAAIPVIYVTATQI